ncbi:MAG: cation diffusion facilitator family transporter [Bacteroidetes bacterium]|nr:cation diffusion facilitator family transporter [Bacteroidota bacterium]
MGHDHHHHHEPAHSLKLAILITAGILVAELAGAWYANSLALFADAGHMVTDLGALILSFSGIRWTLKKPTPVSTFGYKRAEILVGFTNGILLFLLSVYISVEAVSRFFQPEAVNASVLIWVSLFGLTANLVSAFLLFRHSHENLNIRGAFLHVVGDALGSIGAILAGIIIFYTGWYPADAVISVIISLIIIFSAYRLIRETAHILMEAAPASLAYHEVQASLVEIPGVTGLHDLHIWTLSSGSHNLSCHLILTEDALQDSVLRQAHDIIRQKFKIAHATFQTEKAGFTECHNCEMPHEHAH